MQVVFRVLTFAVNGVALRLISRDLLGIVNVRCAPHLYSCAALLTPHSLALLYTTIAFLAREPVRKACLSQRSALSRATWPGIANTVWLWSAPHCADVPVTPCSVPLGVMYAIALSWVWIAVLDPVRV